MIYRSVLFSIFLLYDNIVVIYFIIYQEVLGQFSNLNMQNNPQTSVNMLFVSKLHIRTTVIIVFIHEGIFGDFHEISMIFLFVFSKYDIVIINTFHAILK